MKKILISLIIMGIFIMDACTVAPASAPIQETQVLNSSYPSSATSKTYPYPYPVSESSLRSPYPYPLAEQPLPTAQNKPTPTSDPTLGKVTGQLFEGNKPIANFSLFLGEIKTDAKGEELVAKINPTESPRVETSEDGTFTFVNIKPGRYSLILYTGTSAYLMNIPDKTDPLLFTVETGKTTDLGKLTYDNLPT